MSKIVLFVCLVLLGTVYANTQIRLLNAKYDTQSTISPGLLANANDPLNITKIQTAGLNGNSDDRSLTIPATEYQPLPIYAFLIGTPLTVSVFNMNNAQGQAPPPSPVELSIDNVTLVENQSYSFVYVAQSESDSGSFSAYTTFPDQKLYVFEERPNPSPTGKALLRIVNVAVSTFDPVSNMVVDVIGTGGVANRTVSLAFAEASDFLEYDLAGDVTLEFSLPLAAGTGISNRTITVSLVVGTTQVVYIRGDIGDINQSGSSITSVDFAFPAAPVSPPVTPPTAEPVSAPAVDTPTAPVASTPTAPTTPTAHTPTKKVSSAAQTVAQIAGVAALASLLF